VGRGKTSSSTSDRTASGWCGALLLTLSLGGAPTVRADSAPAVAEPEPAAAAAPTHANDSADRARIDGPETPALPPPRPWEPVKLFGREIVPGKKIRASLRAGESFTGGSINIPALVVRGTIPGPTLCLTAGIHGDEVSGIEVIRQTFESLQAEDLAGMVIGVPVVNLHGFRRGSRYLPDRRDLNRFFPGRPNGSSASRTAHAVFSGVIRRCDALVDLHSGSFYRTNLPQIRADLTHQQPLALAWSFGVGVVLHSKGMPGTLRRAATEAGIPAITYEAGEAMRLKMHEIERGVAGLRNVMVWLGMLTALDTTRDEQNVFYKSRWVRVNDGGIFLTERALGDLVQVDDHLGTVTDPISNERTNVIAPLSGRILGMAAPQVVIPGFAVFHIGVASKPLVEAPAPGAPPFTPPTPDEAGATTEQPDAAEEHPQ